MSLLYFCTIVLRYSSINNSSSFQHCGQTINQINKKWINAATTNLRTVLKASTGCSTIGRAWLLLLTGFTRWAVVGVRAVTGSSDATRSLVSSSSSAVVGWVVVSSSSLLVFVEYASISELHFTYVYVAYWPLISKYLLIMLNWNISERWFWHYRCK